MVIGLPIAKLTEILRNQRSDFKDRRSASRPFWTAGRKSGPKDWEEKKLVCLELESKSNYLIKQDLKNVISISILRETEEGS